MSISFNCTCGKPLTAKEEMAGRKTKCPACRTILTIPGTPPAKPATASKPKVDQPVIPVNPDALVVEGLVWSGPDPAGTDTSAEGAVAAGSTTAREEVRPSDLPKPTDGTMQYKILGQKDHSATGKVNLASLEVCINDYARQGWVLNTAFVINVQSHSGHHDELVVIMER